MNKIKELFYKFWDSLKNPTIDIWSTRVKNPLALLIVVVLYHYFLAEKANGFINIAVYIAVIIYGIFFAILNSRFFKIPEFDKTKKIITIIFTLSPILFSLYGLILHIR